VLLAEDDASVRSLTERVLSRAGYRVLSTADAETALEVLHRPRTRVDLLITDVIMPGMSGPELAAKVTAASPATKILFIAGNADGTLVRNGIAQPEKVLLEKPFSPTELARKVREILDAAAPA